MTVKMTTAERDAKLTKNAIGQEIGLNRCDITDMRVDDCDVTENGVVERVFINDEPYFPTKRFWTSLCSTFSRFGLSPKLFGLYDHNEVFNRLAKRAGDDAIKVSFERDTNNLLAVVSPDKPILQHGDVVNSVADNADRMVYNDGVVTSWHVPANSVDFKIGPDVFNPKFVLQTPIDGFGAPSIYLAMMREVCSNGLMMIAPAFRTRINIAKSFNFHTMQRNLESFSNEEGYLALQNRLEAAASSPASINECFLAQDAITKITSNGGFTMTGDKHKSIVGDMTLRAIATKAATNLDSANVKVNAAFTAMVGDFCALYGLANLESLTPKKRSRIGARCTVYDLINFMTELSTHYVDKVKHNELIQAKVSRLITSDEYDLEGFKAANPQYQDLFVSA